ncbi:hypothetical protein NPIL_628241 [Nephila pilipes]|uniref:Uncharacterized protein n=1 Tax=Nephila pilipes TaxID=299642 RepID=A0A8X6PNK3_NEPPI|nr:hypothetical protein NPIL_628241 [Nephila pilipes]
MEHVVRQGSVKAFITYQEPKSNRIFVSFSSPTFFQKKTFMDNFKRTISEARVENWFDPDAVQWEKISHAFLRNLDRSTLKNADKRIKAKKYHHKAYKLPPPTPAHTPVEERPASGKRPLSKNPFEVPSRKKKMRFARPEISDT